MKITTKLFFLIICGLCLAWGQGTSAIATNWIIKGTKVAVNQCSQKREPEENPCRESSVDSHLNQNKIESKGPDEALLKKEGKGTVLPNKPSAEEDDLGPSFQKHCDMIREVSGTLKTWLASETELEKKTVLKAIIISTKRYLDPTSDDSKWTVIRYIANAVEDVLCHEVTPTEKLRAQEIQNYLRRFFLVCSGVGRI